MSKTGPAPAVVKRIVTKWQIQASRGTRTHERVEKRRHISTPTGRCREAKGRKRWSSGGSRKTVLHSPEPSTSGQQQQQQQPATAAGSASAGPAPAASGRACKSSTLGQSLWHQGPADRGGPSCGGLRSASDTNFCVRSGSSSDAVVTVSAATAFSPAGAVVESGAGETAAEEDGNMGRQQPLREARSILPHLLCAPGQRIQQMFHNSMGSSWKIQQMVKRLQATDDETQQIDRHGMRANGLRLPVASLTGISSSTFREATKMLCDVCSYRPGIAVHLLSENNTDTLRNRFIGDKIQMELAYLNPEKLYAQMCLVGDLLSSLPTDDLLSVDQWLFKLYLQEYVQWQWRDDRRNRHNHSPADSFIVEKTNQADDVGLQLDLMDRHYTIDFNITRQVYNGTDTPLYTVIFAAAAAYRLARPVVGRRTAEGRVGRGDRAALRTRR